MPAHYPPTVTTIATSIAEQPYFDFELQRNVTVTVGQTGFLRCRVEQLGDKDVSIRPKGRQKNETRIESKRKQALNEYRECVNSRLGSTNGPDLLQSIRQINNENRINGNFSDFSSGHR